ncbi:putative MFS family arabinose efflux permease [Knoellia remsis]|uniref:Putative MFS family arabinose efflux permease n=1 Tax=Knoellia remsis TaxID=407159 RepID=A0A2T0UEB5_9MICO|nr:putative MFS family arabinose efflux permease [Knoellia remsis]
MRVTSYSTLLRHREFRALFVSFAALIAATSLGGLALATLVNDETSSPLLTALSLFGPALATVVGASTAMSAADTGRPRRALLALTLLAAAIMLVQTVPGLPVLVRLALAMVLGLVLSVAGGIRLGLLAEVVPEQAYALARSLMNVATGAMQIAGLGGAALLLAVMTPRQLFFLTVLLLIVSAVPVLGVRRSSARPVDRPSLRQTLRVNAWLIRQRRLRPVLLNLWVPNGLIVGCEALFVPYAGQGAGVLFAAGALGMLAGDLTMGRLVTREQRRRLTSWMRVVLAVPFLAFALDPALPVAAGLVLVATVGYSGTLALQERLLALTPAAVRGQVQGVESSGRMTMQGVGAIVAGSLAEVVPVSIAMAICAAASLLLTLSTLRPLARELRSPVPMPGAFR